MNHQQVLQNYLSRQTPLAQELLTQVLTCRGIQRYQHLAGVPCIFQPSQLATEQMHFILADQSLSPGYPYQAGFFFFIAAVYLLVHTPQSEDIEYIIKILEY